MNIKHLFFMLILASANIQILSVHTGNTRNFLDRITAAQKDPRMGNETWRHVITFGIPTAALTVLVSQILVPDLWTSFKMWLFASPKTSVKQVPMSNRSCQTEKDFNTETYDPSGTEEPLKIHVVKGRHLCPAEQSTLAAVRAEFTSRDDRA